MSGEREPPLTLHVVEWYKSLPFVLSLAISIICMDRLNTRDMLQRRHWHVDNDTCVLCPFLLRENRSHLSFECTFWII